MFGALITIFLLLAAFVLLLFVSLSIPIIKSIFLFSLTANVSEGLFGVTASANGSIRFGVWGYCISAVTAS